MPPTWLGENRKLLTQLPADTLTAEADRCREEADRAQRAGETHWAAGATAVATAMLGELERRQRGGTLRNGRRAA